MSFLGESGVAFPEAVLEILQQLNCAKTVREVSAGVEVVRESVEDRAS